MDIKFDNRFICKYDQIWELNDGKLKPLSFSKMESNIVSIDNLDYTFYYLNGSSKTKGGNSIMLELYRSDSYVHDKYASSIPDRILKVLKYSTPRRVKRKSIHTRFQKEVEALKKCNGNNLQSIVKVFESGKATFNTSKKENDPKLDSFLFYTMEYADFDLSSYLELNPQLDFKERVSICLNLAKGLNELFSLDYYHRDLKPDNILLVGEDIKISDLGLIDDRDDNFKIDKKNELIGPKGWLSPEAMNKWLCEDQHDMIHDCRIDHQSDVFQLGKIFCYILQSNNPMGQLRQQDFLFKHAVLRRELTRMLYYSKSKRTRNIQAFINRVKPIEKQLLLDA